MFKYPDFLFAFIVFNNLTCKVHICYLPAGRSVWLKTLTEVLKMLAEAKGSIFKPEVTVFHFRTDPKPDMFIVFSWGKLAYK